MTPRFRAKARSVLDCSPTAVRRVWLWSACVLFASMAWARSDGPAQPTAPSTADSARAAHAMLTRLCDDFGGRLTGSEANRRALQRLSSELVALGYQPELHTFPFRGWERGEDRVEMLSPVRRVLRVAALSYSEPHPPFAADVVVLGRGAADDFPRSELQGRTGLLDAASVPLGEVLPVAKARGMAALLTINRENGGQLLARTGSFSGEALPIPVYSVTQEEGGWIRRLLERGEKVSVQVETRSHSVAAETSNLVVRIPGKTDDLLVVGAHFDSWDLGQGALDNGLGTAQVFALAHRLRRSQPLRTIELVWFNGEEEGMWGSRYEAGRVGGTRIVAMLNLDMVGVPQAVNALGDDSLVPILERWNAARGAKKLPLGVQNRCWFGSDHMPYQLAGVRALTLHGPIDPSLVRYYHDFGDTADKVPEALVVDSTEIIADLVLALANDPGLKPLRRTPADTAALFRKAGLEQRLRAVGWWSFGDGPRETSKSTPPSGAQPAKSAGPNS